jgi:two-component system OmpR family sensor kinase
LTRLFLSLYLSLALTLISLSAVLEYVFISDEPQSSPEVITLIALLENIAKSNNPTDIILNTPNINARVIDAKSFNWQSDELEYLKKGKVVSLFDDQMGQQLYLQSDPYTLLEISLKDPASKRKPYLLYTSLFYVLLAGVLLMWVWPLWRDLNKLRMTISELKPGGLFTPLKLNKRSLITPIAEAFNHLNSQVSQLMSTQRELTGAVAHEFRTPLSRLKFALAVKPKPDSEPWNEMNADVNELEKLVQEMLNFTSMEAHQPELNMSEIPLHELTSQLISNLSKEQLNGRKIILSGHHETIVADEHYLSRAIENLLLNALRYCKDTVTIEIESNIGTVALHIDDDGCGIPKSLRNKVFEPFFRPDEGRDRTRGGAGLGLAIVQRIMQWHNGHCVANESPMGGARLTLLFTDHNNILSD